MTPNELYAGTHRSQYDGSALAASNCTPTSGANGARAATGGRLDKSGAQIRALVKVSEETNPTTPGWSLADLGLAMTRLGVRFETRSGVWSNIVTTHDTGLAIALQGDSDQFSDGTCSGAFDGDHCVTLHPGTFSDGKWPLADPICPNRRPETTTVLRAYAEKFAARVAGRPTSVIRYGVFPDPVPEEADMQITAIKGEDWKPTKNATTLLSNGVFRATPDRTEAVVERVGLDVVIRSIAEIDVNGVAWRLTERMGKVLYMLRSDWVPLVQGGDPAVDKALTDYIAGKDPDCTAQVTAATLAGRRSEWDRIALPVQQAIPARP